MTTASSAAGVMTGQAAARVRTTAPRVVVGWALAAMAVVTLTLLIPLWFTHRYYFYGDTQIGSFPQWYHLGTELRAGHWPLIDLQRWRAGNYVAEGQWGQWNPLVMLVSLAASYASSAQVFCTVLKLVCAAAAALGGFLLSRSYGVRAEAAFVVAVALPLGGVTQYLDLTTWSTGLLVWALLPFTWWSLRRTMIHGANPFAALVFGYLTITVGYVYGTIYLVLVFIACLVDGILMRKWRGVVRVLLIGLCAGLLTVTVYLPGLLTAPVTTRAAMTIYNSASLPVSLRDYAASVLPTGVVPASWGRQDVTPMGYIAWFLPMLAWIRPSRAQGVLRPLAGVSMVWLFVVLWSLGPTHVGPLRYPMRVQPVVVLCTLVLVAVLVTRAVGRPTRGQLAVSILWVFVAAFLTTSRALFAAEAQLVSFVLVAIALTVVWWLWRRGGTPVARVGTRRHTPALVAGVMALCAFGFVALQHAYFPKPQSKERNMPALVSDYKAPLQGAVGDIFMVGAPDAAIQKDASQTSDFLSGSAWYVNGRPIQNTYTTIGFKAYNDRYCISLIGGVCRGALPVLMSTEPQTGKSRLDLLSISTVLLRKAGLSAQTLHDPPAGWHVARETPLSALWVRDNPVPAAGGVVWSSAGTRVETLSQDTRTVRLRVSAVPDGGGTVAFSRLAWPGYRLEGGGKLSDRPVDGYLTTVNLPTSTQGQVVTLRFDPPGWDVALAAWVASVVVSLAWSILALVAWRRRRDGDRSLAGVAGGRRRRRP